MTLGEFRQKTAHLSDSNELIIGAFLGREVVGVLEDTLHGFVRVVGQEYYSDRLSGEKEKAPNLPEYLKSVTSTERST